MNLNVKLNQRHPMQRHLLQQTSSVSVVNPI